MEQYSVTGMSCAACSARVEKAVSRVPGVTSCAVSLLTNSMGVEGSASQQDIIKAVENAGYGAAAKGGAEAAGAAGAGDDLFDDSEISTIKKRLIASIFFLLILMYFSMGHSMAGFPVPSIFEQAPLTSGFTQMLLTAVVMIINKKFFVSGFMGILHRAPNMDTLVALGAGASFLYSTCIMYGAMAAQTEGGTEHVAELMMHGLYFESSAMILTLITVGKLLEAISKGRTTDALKELVKLAPKTALIERDGIETELPVEKVMRGDIFIVKPGTTVPVDGIVIEGSSSVNEAALTGESIPEDKEAGSAVSAATINQTGFLRCEATRVGNDTTLAQIIKTVSEAAASKAPIAKVADVVSGFFVPAVIGVALLVTCGWLLAGAGIEFALARGISVLVISCPCALGLATPVAIMVGSGVGARNGILYKTAASLEAAAKVAIVAVDKTGTITGGDPSVTDIIPAEGYSESELLELAYALELRSEHPLAKAVSRKAEEKSVMRREVESFTSLTGSGLEAVLDGKRLIGGNLRFVKEHIQISDVLKRKADELAEKGKTPLYFAYDGSILGIIAVADTIRDDGKAAVDELHGMGIKVVMLTGDNERTANAVGNEAGVDYVAAGLLPDGKENVIRKLMKQGKTMMVGDGINDAPALTVAEVGVAIGAGTDIAIDAADIVLMNSKVRDVAATVRLSRAALRNIHENLMWAFIYNVICIPLAAGIKIFGMTMNPMVAAAAMSLSSFCVVTNALRLNFVKLYASDKDKASKYGKAVNLQNLNMNSESVDTDINMDDNDKMVEQKKEFIMTKTLNIEGMMCEHCEARVKKALEALDNVNEAQVSHKDGTAVIGFDTDISDAVLTKAVEDQDYKVLSID